MYSGHFSSCVHGCVGVSLSIQGFSRTHLFRCPHPIFKESRAAGISSARPRRATITTDHANIGPVRVLEGTSARGHERSELPPARFEFLTLDGQLVLLYAPLFLGQYSRKPLSTGRAALGARSRSSGVPRPRLCLPGCTWAGGL